LPVSSKTFDRALIFRHRGSLSIWQVFARQLGGLRRKISRAAKPIAAVARQFRQHGY
jgi:ABC-type transport system involved in Fe-S cluster assembly fused permease/ATPase subunit